MSLPKFTASASLYRTSEVYRASDSSTTTDRLRGELGVAAGINPRCNYWEACCLRTGNTYCCNHYFGICVNPL